MEFIGWTRSGKIRTTSRRASEERLRTRNASLKDLCDQDKAKIGNLATKLAEQRSQRQQFQAKLKNFQSKARSKISKLRRQNKTLLRKNQKLKFQVKQLSQLLDKKQQQENILISHLNQPQKENLQSISQILQTIQLDSTSCPQYTPLIDFYQSDTKKSISTQTTIEQQVQVSPSVSNIQKTEPGEELYSYKSINQHPFFINKQPAIASQINPLKISNTRSSLTRVNSVDFRDIHQNIDQFYYTNDRRKSTENPSTFYNQKFIALLHQLENKGRNTSKTEEITQIDSKIFDAIEKMESLQFTKSNKTRFIITDTEDLYNFEY